MKKTLKNVKGITLIALIITIIVLLILAGASISMLTGDNGIITKSTKAKFQTELSGYKEDLSMYITNCGILDETYDSTKLHANKDIGVNVLQGEKESLTGGIKDVITSISSEYLNLLEVHAGKLILKANNISLSSDYEEWAKEIGIDVVEGYSNSDINIINSNKDVYAWYKDNTLYFANTNKDMSLGEVQVMEIYKEVRSMILKELQIQHPGNHKRQI